MVTAGAFQWLLATSIHCSAHLQVDGFQHGLKHRNPRSLPEGSQRFLCSCWADQTIREEHVIPYVEQGEAKPELIAKIGELCAEQASDVHIFNVMRHWLDAQRAEVRVNPFVPTYFSSQGQLVLNQLHLPEDGSPPVHILDYGCGSGEMLKWLHRGRDIPAQALHCIELYSVETEGMFQHHVLQDPVGDLAALAAGPLRERFSIIASFAVFHHVADLATRVTIWRACAMMATPQGVFLLADWDNMDSPLLSQWYDSAHWVLWLLMGAPAPSSDQSLALGTRYASTGGFSEEAVAGGWAFGHVNATKKSSLGGFAMVLHKSLHVQLKVATSRPESPPGRVPETRPPLAPLCGQFPLGTASTRVARVRCSDPPLDLVALS